MKTSSTSVLLLVLVLMGKHVQASGVTAGAQQTILPKPTPFRVVEEGANHRVWQRETYDQAPNGKFVTHVHKVQELSMGLNHLVKGQWVSSKEVIDILPDGSAAATQGQHQAYFPPDIAQGTIRVVNFDGQQLQSQPAALAFDDGANTVIIGVLTNSVGQLVGGNQVIYRNAFAGVNADILYTYKSGGFEQDIILRSQLPSPDSLNLNPASTRFQALTEFFNAPTPQQQPFTIDSDTGTEDNSLQFGSITFGNGKAFMIGGVAQKNPTKRSAEIPVYKTWLKSEGRDFLIEAVPLKRISAKLQTLPLSASSAPSSNFRSKYLSMASGHYNLPARRLAEGSGKRIQLAATENKNPIGLVLDYVQINSDVTNFTFQADTTYYVSGNYHLSGTAIFEGGTVIKLGPASSGLTIDAKGSVNCQTGPYRPAVFTSINDNSVGEGFGSGSPVIGDVTTFLNLNTTNVSFHDMRFNYCWYGIVQNPSPGWLDLFNCQFMNVDIAAYAGNVTARNVLIARLADYGDGAIDFYGTSMIGENVTADVGLAFVEAQNLGGSIYLTNCLITGQPIISPNSATVSLTTNSTVWLPTPSTPVYQTVGSGSYYLTNGSSYRNIGTTNISANLLKALAQKTTYPPLVYAGQSITINTVLGPRVARDTNSLLDVGYHYEPLDYVFGGCDLHTNLTFTAGTAVGLYEDSGTFWMPISITLNDGANLTTSGTAAQPNWMARTVAVQEGGNGNWTGSGWMAPLALNGSGSPVVPSLNSQFTKYSTVTGMSDGFQDAWAFGSVHFNNCEFYAGSSTSYQSHQFFTNCLFYRMNISFWSQNDAPNIVFQNCTFYNGGLALVRYTGQSPSFWNLKNNAFDGTDLLAVDDNVGDTNYMSFDYNVYSSGNTNWQGFAGFGGPATNKLEVVGPHDFMVTNFNWQASWLGNFYLPTNSALINVGSTNANLLGLYHFTTQTNQVKETNTIVEIGYHYVAVDSSGLPIDSNGNGIPDYLEDANNNGIYDAGDLSDWQSFLNLRILITRPRSGSSLP